MNVRYTSTAACKSRLLIEKPDSRHRARNPLDQQARSRPLESSSVASRSNITALVISLREFSISRLASLNWQDEAKARGSDGGTCSESVSFAAVSLNLGLRYAPDNAFISKFARSSFETRDARQAAPSLFSISSRRGPVFSRTVFTISR